MNIAAFSDDRAIIDPPAEIAVMSPAGKPRRTRTATPTTSLSDDVSTLEATLAKSLGVPASVDGYAPDTFVRAVKLIHDKLDEVRNSLKDRQLELDKQEIALRAREKAVQAREVRVAGLVALAPLMTAARQRRPLWGLFSR